MSDVKPIKRLPGAKGGIFVHLIVVAHPLDHLDEPDRFELFLDCSEIVLSCERLLHGWDALSKCKAKTILEFILKYGDVANVLLEVDLILDKLLTVFVNYIQLSSF